MTLRNTSNQLNSPQSPLNRAHFSLLMTALFGVLIAVGLWRHEMWRDEYHAWTLVLHSHSLLDLLRNLRGEGHLPLSYFVFYAISQFTANPQAMQFAQWTIAVLCAYLFLRFSPFRRWKKVLFLLGYFPLFEYGVISRSYSWNMLGLWGFCAVYAQSKWNHKTPWLAWLFLLILVTNESFGVLMALPLAGLLIADIFQQKRRSQTTWLQAVVVTSSIITLLLFLLLRLTSSGQWKALFLHRAPHTGKDALESIFTVLGRAILPKVHLPTAIWDISGWQQKLLSPHYFAEWSLSVLAIIAAALLLYLLGRLILASFRLPLLLWGQPRYFAVWTIGTGLLFLFLVSSGGSIDDARHTGHFYLFFIACWWLFLSSPKPTQTTSLRWLQHVRKHRKSDFTILLLVQMIFGLFSYSLDFVYSFSANHATALFLQRHHLQDAALIVPEAVAVPLKRATYYPQYDKTAIFIPYRNRQQPTPLTNAELARQTQRFIAHHQKQNVVIVTQHSAAKPAPKKYFLWRSPPTIIEEEQYDIYLIPPARE